MSNLDKQLIYVHKYHPNDQDQPINQTGVLPPKTTHILMSASGWRALQNVMVATGTKEKFKEAQVLVLPIKKEDMIEGDELLDLKENDDGSYSYRYLKREATTRILKETQYAMMQMSSNAFFEFDNAMQEASKKTLEELDEALKLPEEKPDYAR